MMNIYLMIVNKIKNLIESIDLLPNRFQPIPIKITKYNNRSKPN